MSFTRDFDQLFNAMTRSAFGNVWVTPSMEANVESTFYPATDVAENDKGYLVSFDLPGLTDKDVKIGVKDRVLTISGERQRQMRDEGKSWSRTERSFGRFTRSFTLPEDVDMNAIEAEFENGVLHLLLPKVPEVPPQEIPIRANGTISAPGRHEGDAGKSGVVKGMLERFFSSDEKTTETGKKH